jgi:methylenetetrahydrofolate dehydrogenase (NADP+)/methenyltetrahydrofolate cyclohydrolase
MGTPHSIKPEMVKEGVVLIDAGTSEQAGKLVGDIDPDCESMASFMTPVPGGVGPITIVSLLRNLF